MVNYTTIRGSKGKYPYHEGKHLIVTVELIAYADESGVHQNPSYLLLAGYLGSPRQWAKFNHAWQSVLEKYSVPEFHAKEFFQKNARENLGYYKDWSASKVMSFLRELLKTIPSRLSPIGCGVKVPDFKSQPENITRWLTGATIEIKTGKPKRHFGSNNPYHFAFVFLLEDAAEHASEGNTIHFKLDRQNMVESLAVKTFHRIIDAQKGPPYKEKMGNITYADSIKESGLQLADLYCYAWQRLAHCQELGSKLDELITMTLDTIAKRRNYLPVLDGKSMSRLVGGKLWVQPGT